LAVKTACPCCRKPFSAPEDYVGKKVECPRCGHRSILRTPEEARDLAEREAEAKRQLEDDRQRLALIERQEERKRKRGGAVPYYERFQTGLHAVRHYSPNAPSRFMRLRALSDFLILGAYLALLLALVGAGLTIYLHTLQVIGSVAVLLVYLVGWGLVGTTLFLLLKSLGEVAFLLADVGDDQRDVVELLLDVRENTDPRPEPGPGPGREVGPAAGSE
jgi:hypothetical protein